jgi:predicted ATP-dependent protease
MRKKFELKISDLRLICDPKIFKFKNTSEVKPLDTVIGQERAVEAIDFGLNMNDPGYNIFVTGLAGTGKSTIVRDLDSIQQKNETGHRKFKKRTARSIRKRKLSKIKNKYADRQNHLYEHLEIFAAKNNLQIEQTEDDFQTIPIVDGQPITPEDFNTLPGKVKSKIEENLRSIQSEIESTAMEMDKINLSLHADIEKLMDEYALSVVKKRLDPIRKEFKASEAIVEHLNAVQEHIVENFNLFIPPDKSEPQPQGQAPQNAATSFQQYKVNVLVDQESTRGAPVIFESNPTYYNVFGRIEKRAFMGTVNTDFTMVQAGSLLNANGGFLIMEIDAAIMNPYVWEALKRTLRTKCLQIEDIHDFAQAGTDSVGCQSDIAGQLRGL